MRSADENVLINLVFEFPNGHFQAVLSLLFDYTYNTALYEPQVAFITSVVQKVNTVCAPACC